MPVEQMRDGDGRDAWLASLAGSLRRPGLSREAIEAALRVENKRFAEPLPEAAVERIAKSIAERHPEGPDVVLVAGTPPGTTQASIDAVDLLALELPPLRMIVPDLIPEGTTVLASPPKVGKSCLVYQIAVEVAIGGELFGKRVSPGSVLYLALEDGQRRGQERLRAALAGRTMPRDRLTVQWGARKIGEGLEDDIRAWLDAHPDAAVVAIDTLQRVRPHQSGRRNAYEVDVEDLARLQDLFRDRHVALLIVHHSRKDAADDFLASVSGTYGITGSVDTIVVIKRKRLEMFGTILATGRDIPEAEVPVRFDGMMWEEAPESLPEARFERAEVYRLIAEQGPIFPAAIGKQTGQSRQSVQNMVGKLAAAGDVVRRPNGYETVPRARMSLLTPVSLPESGERHQRHGGHEGAQNGSGALHHTCHGCQDPILDLADAFFDGGSSTFWHREHWDQQQPGATA